MNDYQIARQRINKELKPCPFCGGEARLKKHQRLEQTWYVQCNDCGIRTRNYTQCAYESWKTTMDASVRAWNMRVNLEVDEAYQLEYETITPRNLCACYYCEHFEREGWSHCKIHEGTYGDTRCNDYKKLEHKETVTEFADKCRECGKTIKQRYVLDELKEIREEIYGYYDARYDMAKAIEILDKKISELEVEDADSN